MELKIIGEHLHRAVMEGIMPPPTREGKEARRIYNQMIKPSEEERKQIERENKAKRLWFELMIQTIHKAHHSGKYYIPVDKGVLIIPEDLSYTQFINNTWYD